jgi:hypothetical protein
MRLRTFFLGSALAAIGACTPGSVGGDDVIGGDDDTSLPGTALCEATLSLTGTMISPGTVPTEDVGCVPQGTWTVNVTVSDEGGCGSVVVPGVYTYEVVGTGHNETITSTSNTDQEDTLGIHALGSGVCEGSFEHIWAVDGGFAVILLKADATSWEQTIEGYGTYQLWSEHP